MYFSWKTGALALAAAFLAAVILVKPIGVSTQFVIFDAALVDIFIDDLIVKKPEAKSGYGSSNAYLNKSGGKYAKSAAHPMNYGFVFVLAMILGGWIGAKTQKRKAPQLPVVFINRFGESPRTRYLMAFLGGAIVLWGARLAGGCTSGHMMSGMMQTSVSGYLFALGAFATAVPTAIYLYYRPIPEESERR